MARASARGGRRPRPDARQRIAQRTQQAAPQPVEQPKKKTNQKSWEDQLFLARLRRHMKWVFVLLALVFAIGFVVFGVGTGTGGGSLGDVLRDLFGRGSNGPPTLAQAEQKVADHPNDPTALHDLAVAQQNAQQYETAAATFEKYLKLRPSDQDALRSLAGNYASAASVEQALASRLSSQGVGTGFLSNACQFQNSTGFLNAVCENPVDQATASANQARANEASTRATNLYGKQAGVYARLVKLTPDDPLAYELWGASAQRGNDNAQAIKAYKEFLKRFPDDPDALTVRKRLAGLQAVSDSLVG